ncbi:hypothetical protein EUGRSUZ_L00202 [Eucalyptus grandis]|uniref:Uncharacterized protein n=1 Tax=Eucalyptus grandis TaxID=71139 RepID=A0A058ZX06_EUCGR|nr:hypothetical protein EUGRSUZ_L00202 [Eucalyptus grandis]
MNIFFSRCLSKYLEIKVATCAQLGRVHYSSLLESEGNFIKVLVNFQVEFDSRFYQISVDLCDFLYIVISSISELVTCIT